MINGQARTPELEQLRRKRLSMAHKGKTQPKLFPWDDLGKLYINDCLSMQDIALLKGCAVPSVAHNMKRQSIPSRSYSEALILAAKQGKLLNCGIRGERNALYGKPRTDEVKQKISAKNSGEGNPMFGRTGASHPNWKGGIGNEPYPFEFNDELKAFIRDRDNHTCQLCGVPEIECLDILNVHHIDYIKEHIYKENLISLCRRCNCKVNVNRGYWESYFVQKIAEIYAQERR